MADIQDRCRMPQETLEAPGVVVLPKLLRVGKTYLLRVLMRVIVLMLLIPLMAEALQLLHLLRLRLGLQKLQK